MPNIQNKWIADACTVHTVYYTKMNWDLPFCSYLHLVYVVCHYNNMPSIEIASMIMYVYTSLA